MFTPSNISAIFTPVYGKAYLATTLTSKMLLDSPEELAYLRILETKDAFCKTCWPQRFLLHRMGVFARYYGPIFAGLG